jgi:hypothetical protein
MTFKTVLSTATAAVLLASASAQITNFVTYNGNRYATSFSTTTIITIAAATTTTTSPPSSSLPRPQPPHLTPRPSNRYATLDDWDPDDTAISNRATNDPYRALPSGWRIASPDPDVVLNVITTRPWGSVSLVTADGQLYVVAPCHPLCLYDLLFMR